MKNAKEKTPQPPELQMQNTWKKGNKYQVSFPEFMKHHSKKKQTFFPLKSSEILTLMHMFLNRASRLPLVLLCRLHGLE